MSSRPANKLSRNTVSTAVRRLPVWTNAGSSDEVLSLIAAAKQRAHPGGNTELVGLYRELGGYNSRRTASAEWGDGVLDELEATFAPEYPGRRGFSASNLFRMSQCIDADPAQKKVPRLVHHLASSRLVTPLVPKT